MESWIKVTPAAGNGNGNVSISADAHTGRVARTGTVKIQNQNGTKPSKNITVNQALKACFITPNTLPTTIVAAGGQLTITGKSNGKVLWVEEENSRISGGGLTVNGVVQTNTAAQSSPEFVITGDPGASNEYNFELKITIPQNTSAKVRNLAVHVCASATNSSATNIVDIAIPITQAGATSTLSVNKEAVSLVTAGTAQTVAVTSNDNWVVS